MNKNLRGYSLKDSAGKGLQPEGGGYESFEKLNEVTLKVLKNFKIEDCVLFIPKEEVGRLFTFIQLYIAEIKASHSGICGIEEVDRVKGLVEKLNKKISC